MKNLQSVSSSAIVGNMRFTPHIDICTCICIITVFPKKFHYKQSIHEANRVNNSSDAPKY